MSDDKDPGLYEEALRYHAQGHPGKLRIMASKPVATQHDLSLAYSPGVAAPCLAIAEREERSYDYTGRGNRVAVISNGTAVLGLGNLGPHGAKPVMEGKAVLFKRFADIDAIDLEIDSEDVDQIVNAIRYLGPSFGGINLEDFKAPECFIIEQRLRELMDIPVFHDDQHGTAIIAAAGFINALDLTGRRIEDTKLVVNGAGAAAIACLELLKAMGLPHDNAILCDTRGVIYKGREAGMNQWKSAHAADTRARTLAEAMKDADCFFGLSAPGVVDRDMVMSMGPKPIIFAMANPEPEVRPEEVLAMRDDAIIATGRSDYPNQVNNVLGFPYIFRGALDVRATTINEPMKIAAARALAELAREDVPDEVAAAYKGERLRFGPSYIIPAPFDPRLIHSIPPAVTRAAMESGVARMPIIDEEGYRNDLRARLDVTAGTLQSIFAQVRNMPRRVVFAEGEEEKVVRAAIAYQRAGYGTPVLIGREAPIREMMRTVGVGGDIPVEIYNARELQDRERYYDFVYSRLQRQGMLYRDCVRLVNQDRNSFAACMVALGDADAMVTGVTRRFSAAFEEVSRIIEPEPGRRVLGVSTVIARDRTVFMADTTVTMMPDAAAIADIAVQAAEFARQMGHVPRVALLSYSTFGNPKHETGDRVREAVKLLEARQPDFEFDGEMSVDVALNPETLALYPFCGLSEPANVLVFPGLHSANIASKLIAAIGGATVVGPLLLGLQKPVQIAPIGATVSDLVNLAALAAHEVGL
ncbi:NADP-dependent malic enzyme [Oceanibacterium hippocampi]|uniref:NADP-dependent malic enzyme n=1 Tax=Oceanibacterium hippocampi TaxID=745714 RepID=A0A1Y5RMF5_9PROT|nr:NADP-dependent malic enzyme [Oceanibacterium hippocampi]SLN19770.1 NADP-dependent malic enzyme [Oceanibacterium hippocampi]